MHTIQYIFKWNQCPLHCGHSGKALALLGKDRPSWKEISHPERGKAIRGVFHKESVKLRMTLRTAYI